MATLTTVNPETTFLADSFLSGTGIAFEYNQREALQTALATFLNAYAENVVTATLTSLAQSASLAQSGRGESRHQTPEGAWI